VRQESNLMKKVEDTHHLTELLLMPVEPYRNPEPVRPPLPVSEIYPMGHLEVLIAGKPEKPMMSTSKPDSIFFKSADAGIEKDPFLRRLSRLN